MLKGFTKRDFNIVWAVMASYGSFAVPFFKILNPRIKFLLTLQEGDDEGHILGRVGLFYPFWKLVFKKADHIQAISSYLADFAKRHGARCPVEVVPNGVDLEKFKDLSLQKNNDNFLTLITTSRLVAKNGVDILIKATKELKVLIPDYKLDVRIVGDGQEKENLKNLSKSVGVEDIVKFVGEVEPKEIPSELAKADIFVRPSRSEGLGISFLEAMAAGLPVVATPVGGIPDFIKDGETGVFARTEDSEDLAEKIILLIKDKSLRDKIAKEGKNLVFSNYSWGVVSESMGRILKIINEPPSKIKIGVATGLYPPEIGGPATHTVLMERELSKKGFKIEVLAFSRVRSLPKIIRHIAFFILSLGLAARNEIIFAQDTMSVGFPSLLAARVLGKKFVVRVPGDYVWEQSRQRFGVVDRIDEFQKKSYGLRIQVMRKIQSFVVSKANIAITPSDYFNRLVSGWAPGRGKVKTIYNGVNVKEILESEDQKREPRLIVSAGRLVPWKGFYELIDLMEDLPEWKLNIFGGGPEESGLRKKVKEKKLEDRVFLKGSVSREELVKWLKKSTLFILNASFESFSFQTVEAMAAGAPTVVTNIGSLPELIEDGKNGVLFTPNNKKEMLEAIKRIEADAEFREKISRNGEERAKYFSIENSMQKLSKVLKELV